jgi:TonB family protein
MKRVVLPIIITVIFAPFACGLSHEALFTIGKEQQKYAIYTPKPHYPLKALADQISGSGVFVIRVHVKTGRVVGGWVSRSTGSALLDSAAKHALSRWRFQPGRLTPIGSIAPWRHDSFGKEDALLKVPITFVP